MADNNGNKRFSMAIRVVVILALAFFAVDEFYLKNKTPEPTAEEIQAKLSKAKKPKKKREQALIDSQAEAKKSNEVNQDKVSTESGSNEAANSPEVAPVENVNVMEKTQKVESETLDQKIDKIAETLPVENTAKIEKETVPETVTEIQMTQKINANPEETNTAAQNPIEEIKIPSQEKTEKTSLENSMTSKIIETIVETAPPAYDQLGRGLVYNCKDKYWACVDRSAYLTCNKNFKYNESVGKSKECVVQAIYASDEDCAKVQKYNVSVNQSTDFCKN